MIKIFKRVGISILFALWLEFFYKFGATLDVHNFVGSIFVYFIYLMMLHSLCFKADAKKHLLLFLCLFGFIGLMAEWFIIGNSPWQNPNAFQVGMFVFHAVYPALGILFFMGEETFIYKKRVVKVFVIFTICSMLGFLFTNLDLRFAWFIWIPLFPYFISFGLIVAGHSIRLKK